MEQLNLHKINKDTTQTAILEMASGHYSLVSELLECPVCLEVMVAPVKIFQCDNGHAICETCKNNPEVSSCPSCRLWFTSTSPPRRNLLAEKLARAVVEMSEIVNNMEPLRDMFKSEVLPTAPQLEQIFEKEFVFSLK